jgi:thiol:disulfide interchange protein
VILSPTRIIAVTAACATLFLTASCSRPQPQPSQDAASTVTAHGSVAIDWARDLPAALDRARSEDKPVLINFYADWCVWCKRLEATTLRDAEVASLLKERVIPVSLDVDGDGRELSNRYRVDGLPTILVLDAEGRELGRIPGYISPTGFLETVEQFLSRSRA